jgi:colanic acid biosynthesis glycosyl transferase WcaI
MHGSQAKSRADITMDDSKVILVHDFAGHPFQAELSRHLAKRGHKITHGWFAGETGPKGRLTKVSGDPDTLAFQPFGTTIPYSKSNFVKRRGGDIAYGREVAEFIRRERPRIVLSGNTPTEAQESIVTACLENNIPFIYWCQDIFSIAATKILAKKLPVLGHAVGRYYRFLERRQMQNAAMVVLISKGFYAQTDAWGIGREKTLVIPNWGALDEIDVMARDNDWSRKNGLNAGFRFLYSGTLAMKHNPALLSALAAKLGQDESLVVVSAGVGADHLRNALQKQLLSFPLQSFEDFPEVLGAGDVLLAVIEREAGQYSVPSKILSYLCAGRPIVLAAPKTNLAAQILIETGAGKVVEPEDIAGFVAAALGFRDDADAAKRAGLAGRAYAEMHFQLDRIAMQFETLFRQAVGGVR